MNLIAVAFCAFLVLASSAAISNEIPLVSKMSSRSQDIRRRIDEAGGCNANICFAIDGSGSINATEFEAEKAFVLSVAGLIGVDEPVEYAAVQYSTGNTRIRPLGADTFDFILRVNRTTQRGGFSFVSAGIGYCFGQLTNREGEANKIVLLGDGRSNIGPSAIELADLFRSEGGHVCAVGAGFNTAESQRELLGIAGGDSSRVFRVGSFLEVLKLQRIVEDLVAGICLGELDS